MKKKYLDMIRFSGKVIGSEATLSLKKKFQRTI